MTSTRRLPRPHNPRFQTVEWFCIENRPLVSSGVVLASKPGLDGDVFLRHDPQVGYFLQTEKDEMGHWSFELQFIPEVSARFWWNEAPFRVPIAEASKVFKFRGTSK